MSERLTAFILYVALLTTVLGAGAMALAFAVDYRFYSGFLAPWHQALETYARHGRPWPEFRNNHVEYMLDLSRRMARHTDFRPPGSGRAAFMYRLERVGRADEHVLVLGLPSRMVVYGLNTATARRLDRFADGRVDLAAGAFRGQSGATPDTTIVIWNH